MTTHHIYLTDEAAVIVKDLAKKNKSTLSKVICESVIEMSKANNEIKDRLTSSLDRIEEKIKNIEKIIKEKNSNASH